MCGIAGIFGGGSHDALAAMTRRLAHRGPDGSGTERIGQASLGVTRLSLLDRVHGGQPRRSDDGTLVLVYNGEVYNHREIRRTLEARGQAFEGRCDTEVVLRAFAADGASCVERLEGMYAFAVSDGRRLWLARDAFGIKPLYYAVLDGGRRLVFASELKALLEVPDLPRALDRAALLEQAVFGFYLENKTPFVAVRELAPGAVLTCRVRDGGELTFELQRHSRPRPKAPDDLPRAASRLRAALREAVAQQRVADHPIGVYLSGGLDSSLLAALMVEDARAPVHTFATADRPDHPDLAMARTLAAELGTRHHERVVSARDLLAALPSAVVELEGTSMPSIAEMAAPALRCHVKAALCGDGADELFAGYAMHAYPGRWLQRWAERYDRLVRRQGVRDEDARDAWAALSELAGPEPVEVDDLALRDRFHAFYLGSQLTVAHLRRWDAGTMAHGLELRVPYLTRPLRDLALALPWSMRLRGRTTKVALRAAARGVLPARLERAILERPKLPAPAAFAGRARAVERYLARFVPAGPGAEPHPFRPFVNRPIERYLLDLFVLLFVGRGGRPAGELDARDLYGRHGEELNEALKVATAPVPIRRERFARDRRPYTP